MKDPKFRTKYGSEGEDGFSAMGHCHTVAAWALVGVAAVGAVAGGMAANDAAKAQAGGARQQAAASISEAATNEAFRNQEAIDVMMAAQNDADTIKQSARQMRAQIISNQAGSGVVIGEGSAQAAVDQLETLSTADALAAIFSGANQSTNIRAGARVATQAATNKRDAYLQAANSMEQAGRNALIGGFVQAGIGIAGAAYGQSLKQPGTGGSKSTAYGGAGPMRANNIDIG